MLTKLIKELEYCFLIWKSEYRLMVKLTVFQTVAEGSNPSTHNKKFKNKKTKFRLYYYFKF